MDAYEKGEHSPQNTQGRPTLEAEDRATSPPEEEGGAVIPLGKGKKKKRSRKKRGAIHTCLKKKASKLCRTKKKGISSAKYLLGNGRAHWGEREGLPQRQTHRRAMVQIGSSVNL